MFHEIFQSSVCVKAWNGPPEEEAYGCAHIALIPRTHFFISTVVSPEIYRRYKFSSRQSQDIAVQMAEIMESQGFDISNFTKLAQSLDDLFSEERFETAQYSFPMSVYLVPGYIDALRVR